MAIEVSGNWQNQSGGYTTQAGNVQSRVVEKSKEVINNMDVKGSLSGQEYDKNINDSKDIGEKAKKINKVINENTVAEFGYHEATHQFTIKIKDKTTNEVIKEVPSEKILEMITKAWELAGIMVDEKR